MARAEGDFRFDTNAVVSDLVAVQRWYYGWKEISGGLEVVFVCGEYWVLVVVLKIEVVEA